MTRLLSLSALTAVLLAAPVLRAETDAPPASPADTAVRRALMAGVARQITDHFHLRGDLQIDTVPSWQFPPLPAGKPARIVVTEFTSMPASSMLVRCRLEAGGAPPLSLSLLLHAHLWADAWVSREPVSLGSSFDPSLLDARQVDLLQQRFAVPVADTAGGDFIYACSVPAGQLLIWRDLKRRPLVRRGDTIDVSAVNGPLTVTVKAIAMQSGGKGETVLVRNLETRREFNAVVVDPGHAEINF